MVRNTLFRFLALALLFLMMEPATAAGWFGKSSKDSVTIFQRDAAKAWQSGKVASKEKAQEAKRSASKTANQAKQSLNKASATAKEKGRQAAKEGQGLLRDVKTRFGILFGSDA